MCLSKPKAPQVVAPPADPVNPVVAPPPQSAMPAPTVASMRGARGSLKTKEGQERRQNTRRNLRIRRTGAKSSSSLGGTKRLTSSGLNIPQ